ncbi:alpha/beta hydrolase [Candidatus Woesearchaeota archaeon]|nr:MAG: alpha/beta hydrolase [Candidatus Woesearchaeota archaeon]
MYDSMEKKLKIPIGKKFIYCTLNYQSPSDKLIILVHGLGGHQNEHIHYNAKNLFIQKGYAVLRFNLYSTEHDARKIEECSISTNSADLAEVIGYFEKKFKAMYLIGHSLGGPVILHCKATAKAKKIMLWDPSLNLKIIQKRYTFNKTMNLWQKVTSGIRFIGKEMHQELGALDTKKQLAKISTPLKIILAEKSMWAKQKHEIAALNIKVKIIPKADHNFDEEGVEEQLLKETLDFLKS